MAASRAKPHGLTAEVTKKQDAKYDPVAEQEATAWIAAVLDDDSIKEAKGREEVQKKLKDGVILCNLVNKLKPGSIKTVHQANANNFKHMENISNFLKVAEKVFGCDRGDLFQTVYLTDNQNMSAVIGGIYAVARKAQMSGWDGPQLGPKEATSNPREFTKEQMESGRIAGY